MIAGLALLRAESPPNDPVRISSERELGALHPQAQVAHLQVGPNKVDVLFLYKGSGIIRSVLHFYQSGKKGKLTWRTSMLVESRRATVKARADGEAIEVYSESGTLVAELKASFFASYIEEYDKEHPRKRSR